jgi:hypothetical protein
VLLPVYSTDWPQRVNIEYWIDADSGHAHWWLQAASQHVPHTMAEAVKFDPLPRPRFAGYPTRGFFADAIALQLPPPELTQVSAVSDASETSGASGAPRDSARSTAHFELRLRSMRGAPRAFAVFPARANLQNAVVMTPTGPLRAKLHKFSSGETALVLAGLPSGGQQFGIDAVAAPLTVQVFDQSYGLPPELPAGAALQRARPQNATSSQDGDVTVVQRTVRLDPAAGR